MNIEKIKTEIREQGIRRIEIKLNNIDNGIANFIDIMKEMLSMKNETLQLDEISHVVEYFIRWTYLMDDSIEYNKGILLKGLTGRGKTFLFRAWINFLKIDRAGFYCNNEIYQISPLIVNVKRIAGEYQDPANGGYQVIEKYSNVKSLMLDDIGKEDQFSMNYGNKVNIIEEIINIREELGMLTFGTTNYDKLADLYDDRTVSRMHKLFNVVPINHKIDFRTL